MKSNFFAFFLFILSAQALLSSASESTSKSRNKDFNSSNRLVQREEAGAAGLNQTLNWRYREEDDGKGYEGKNNSDLVYSVKVKGKGSFGGANVVHRPKDSQSTALASVQPSFLVTAIIACASFGWFY